ncbi:hypothetical protein HZA42_03660 [Candidatus Peregrinibacteria bacterium]|nr:hypothetical protein [Candidatus Peregrinibacteria bacterium]
MGFFHLLALLPFTFFAAHASPVVDIAPPLHGIYLTSQTVANKTGEKLVSDLSKVGGNMIIFDVQNSSGRLAYQSKLPISIEIKNNKDQIPNLSATIKKLHDKGFYVVARLVTFNNPFLAQQKPQWVLKRKGSKNLFVSREGAIWLDPGNPELKEYLIDIGREISLAGADEIQLDYVRFPAGGKGGYIGYNFTGDDMFTRDQAITNFVSEFASAMHLFGTSVGVDIFGIVVWDNVSWKVIGQNIGELGKYVEAIYPMPYPSHFGPGWGGHKNPADEPYFFVQETTKKFLEQTKLTSVKIRPWLQGFVMRTSSFGPNYIKEQIRALKDIGIGEFSVWNASNNYWATMKALADFKM